MKSNSENADQIREEPLTGMRFQKRDGELLQAIYERGGVMARRQIMHLFWPRKSTRAMEKRLAKLFRMGYISWPSRKQRRSQPIPEPVIWLNWKGIAWIAGRSGISLGTISGENENQLRKLEGGLREKGIHWLREPHWAQLEHDLAVGDFRLAVENALRELPMLRLEEWVNETTFRSMADMVEFAGKNGGSSPMPLRRRVIPDGYFALVDGKQLVQGSKARARFLLEIDLSTHDNASFGREKVLPGIAYLLSPAYKRRFGDNSGRWLVVTTGERRMRNLKRQAEQVAREGASAFFFTTFNRLTGKKVLTAPIWYRGGEDHPSSLLVLREPFELK
jgi:hypothetical protein